jgi:hypothetical protein
VAEIPVAAKSPWRLAAGAEKRQDAASTSSFFLPPSSFPDMRLAVLGSSDSWYFKDLHRAAAGRHELLSVTFCDLGSTLGAAEVSVASGDCRLNDVKAVLVRTMPPV